MLFAAGRAHAQSRARRSSTTSSARGSLAPWIARHGGKPLMWKTGHSLIKAKMKETGAPLAGEMSGHIVLQGALVRLRRRRSTPARGCWKSSRASQTRAPCSTALPDALVHARAATGSAPRASRTRWSPSCRPTRNFPGAERRHRHRRPARRISGRLRPRARVEHDAGDRAALRGRQRRPRSSASSASSAPRCNRETRCASSLLTVSSGFR